MSLRKCVKYHLLNVGPSGPEKLKLIIQNELIFFYKFEKQKHSIKYHIIN